MKLTELKENKTWSLPPRDRIGKRGQSRGAKHEQMIDAQLENARFSQEIREILANLDGDSWGELIRSKALRDAAARSYDYADDSGPSIHINDRNVRDALQEIGFMGRGQQQKY